jgi:hypothetical protein
MLALALCCSLVLARCTGREQSQGELHITEPLIRAPLDAAAMRSVEAQSLELISTPSAPRNRSVSDFLAFGAKILSDIFTCEALNASASRSG